MRNGETYVTNILQPSNHVQTSKNIQLNVFLVKKMGCVSSKTDINDRHPNIFQVINVNDQGRPISPGKLQVTETELVFYQRGKKPTKWPLRSLRKYGFDTAVFSFECGRRCPTGHGIYAFKCKKAEHLFNIVQLYITGNVNEENNSNVNTDVPMNGPLVARRPNMTEGYLNPVVPNVAPRVPTVTSRPSSVSSNGPISPTAISPPPTEHNNNKRSSLVRETLNSNPAKENDCTLPPYANLASNSESSSRVYMNIDTNNAKDFLNLPEEVDVRHCYANIDAKDLESLRPMSESVPPTPTTPYIDLDYNPVREVNYAELDLDIATKEPAPEISSESPKVEKKSYATIDFQKTTALSQSINPRMTVEEGIRKTRHNSTIHSLSD